MKNIGLEAFHSMPDYCFEGQAILLQLLVG